MTTGVLAELVGRDIAADDVRRVRGAIYPDMRISPEEAELLFQVNDAAGQACPEWRMLFVEALTDYVVRQQAPEGYVDEAQARWLTQRIARDGTVKTATELELLVRILEVAVQAPPALSALALRAVVAFALTPQRQAGHGPTLTAEEVGLVRRVVYAFAGDGEPAMASRAEAEAVFDLNDAARGRPNDPAWRDLFAKAVGGALLAASGYQPPDRQAAARLDAWLRAPADSAPSILFQAVRLVLESGLKPGLDAMAEPDIRDVRHQDAQAAAAIAERITDEEAAWLVSRIGRDGALDDNEAALLQFVAERAANPHPALKPLLDRIRPSSTPQAPAAPVFGRRGLA